MNTLETPRPPMSNKPANRYRPNVAAIVQDSAGRILICERSDIPGAWQFPQGGVEPGETHREALEREMREELSLEPGDYEMVSHKGPYRYLLGNGRTKNGYHGQEQEYFLVKLTAPESRIDVGTPEREFRAWKWISPTGFDLRWLLEMKRDVYRQVLRDFFGVEIRGTGQE
jgi:putative (di)nucleoside polyphosphate hydrolase